MSIVHTKELSLFFILVCQATVIAAPSSAEQEPTMVQDPTLNNLVHAEGTITCELGELGHVEKQGHGELDMILIAGRGFGWDIYREFMALNRERYTMYAVTIAGYGGTAPPPMPPEGSSYGEQTWMKAAEQAIVDLALELKKPVVVGHFLEGTQYALRLAIDHADTIHAAIIIGGAAMVLPPGYEKVPSEHYMLLSQRIAATDTYYAPQWFKTVTRETWNANDFAGLAYSNQPHQAQRLFQIAVSSTLPTLIRYYCEFAASDISLEFADIRAPVLVLLPDFPPEILSDPNFNYLKPLFYDSFDSRGPDGDIGRFGQVESIEDSHLMMMIDQPQALSERIWRFVSDDEALAEQRRQLARHRE